MNKPLIEEFNQLVAPFVSDVNNHCAKHLQKDRFLIPIIASITQGIIKQLPDQVEQALNKQVEPETIAEVIYQLVPVIGTLKVEQALSCIQKVFAQHQVQLSLTETATDQDFGARVQSRLYGTEIKNLLKDLPDEAGQFIPHALTQHFFNDFYNRETLPVRDRERYELLALITLNVEFQIKAHARGSLKAGNTESELIWSVIQLLPYVGFPFVINSVQVIHQAASQLAEENS